MPTRLPVAGGGTPPEPPAYGGLGAGGWSRGKTFLELLENAGPARAGLEAAFAAVALPPSRREFFAHFPRPVRVLALADLSQADSEVNVAQAERLFTWGRRIWMRTFQAREHLDLVALFGARELPLLVFFGADKREFARWGPRPQALLVLEQDAAAKLARGVPADAERATAAAAERLRRDFYSRSCGADLAAELRRLLAT